MKLTIILSFIFTLLLIIQIVYSQQTSRLIPENEKVQKFFVDEERILERITIENQTYVYDVQLAIDLQKAGIKFNLQDLIDYTNMTEVGLLLEYDRAQYDTGPFAVVTNIPKRISNYFRENAIRNSVEKADGELNTFYERLPYTSITVKKEKIKDLIGKFPKEVKKIYVSSIMRTLLDDSIPIIKDPEKADYIENKYGKLDGSGIKIAIIDTGIDKTHPDLDDLDDNLNTNDPKVVAEKDFTGDNNPSDEIGHGTHVASIAAGTGEASDYRYVGVAPNAELLNAKVCELWGCSVDWIIASMEWAVENKADVISMSLGGDRNQPLEDAVRWAVSQGVVVVVAAGNSGPGGDWYCRYNYGSICSPGNVEEVITVGATDKEDVIAGFSSRGPTEDDLLVKPDVVAPGVDICAASAIGSLIDTYYEELKTCENDEYISLSGTSMATPHVSGAVALLLQAHPDWNPTNVKSSIVGTAERLLLSPYEQGGGRIDAYSAVDNYIVSNKPVLNLGPIISNIDSSFSLSNLGNGKYGVRISAPTYDIATGRLLDVTVNVRDACIQGKEKIDAPFSVNQDNLPSGHYSGYFTIGAYTNCDFSSQPMVLNLPIGFSKIRKLTIKVNTPHWFSLAESKSYELRLFAEDGNTLFSSWWNTDLSKTIFVSEDYFDVFVKFRSYDWNKLKVSYNVKKADLRSTNELTLFFDENDAKELSTNINDILKSKGMDVAMLDFDFSTPDYFTGFSTSGEIQDWRVAFNTKDTIGSNFKFSLSAEGKLKGKSWKDSNKLIILPINTSHPFDAAANIADSELKEVVIEHHDSAKHIGPQAGKYNYYSWRLASYDKDGLFLFLIIPSNNPPPTTKTFLIRESPECSRCSYLLFTDFYRLIPIDNDYLMETEFFSMIWNGGEYPGDDKMPDKITVFEKPFTIRVDKYGNWENLLVGSFQDKYDIVDVWIYTVDKGKVTITSPSGKQYTTTGGLWGIDCYYLEYSRPQIEECEIGDYEIDWQMRDIIKSQDIDLQVVANWDGSVWTVKEKTEDVITCRVPEYPNCSVNTDCKCLISLCEQGWLRVKMPNQDEIFKYFTANKTSFKSGYVVGTAVGHISCLIDGIEYPVSYSIN